MLTGSDALVIAARCVRDDTLRQLRQTTPGSHPELRRYREAGAIRAALLTFPGDAELSDGFFSADLMMDYSQAVVLEGDSPLRFVDLRVFVAPPPAEGHQLFVRCTHERRRYARESTAALEQLLRQPDGMVDALGVIGGARLAELGREHPELLEKMRARLGGVAQARRAPQPESAGRSPIATPASSTRNSSWSTPATMASERRPSNWLPTSSGSVRTTICSPTSSAPEEAGSQSRPWRPTSPTPTIPPGRRRSPEFAARFGRHHRRAQHATGPKRRCG